MHEYNISGKTAFSRFHVLPGSACGIVKCLLIAYFIGNICAKKLSKSVHMCQSHSKPKVGRFLRHDVVYNLGLCVTKTWRMVIAFVRYNSVLHYSAQVV